MKRTSILILALALVAGEVAYAQAGVSETTVPPAKAVVTVDPETVVGAVKPMNAANNGPVEDNRESYKALRIPFARTHDTALGEAYGHQCVDITKVFPDFSAPVNAPSSYDFTLTDKLLSEMRAAGTEPFFRLGQSIEHPIRKYGIYPPKSFKKWARICEHIIRHYNEGWADGFHWNIRYWEIWNEADLDVSGRWRTDPRTWAGTLEEYNAFYAVAAKHLKKCFPDLKIGGPAFANAGKYGPDFLDDILKTGAPMDFYSWHIYAKEPKQVSDYAYRMRKMLDERGFTGVESILDEWNYVRSWEETDHYGDRVRPSVKGAAFIGGVMCACQNAPVDMLMYYDLRPTTTWNGAYHPFTYDLQPPYWALYYWAELAACGTQVQSQCADADIYTCAARSADGKVRLLLVRYHEDDAYDQPCEVALSLPAGWIVRGIRLIDSRGMDRPAEGAALVMESNAVALLEIGRQ